MNKLEWKLLRDPYYGPLYQTRGLDYALDAGFFYDTDKQNHNVRDSLDILCTPTAFLGPIGDNPCVLLNTGAYCPPHQGHIQMMEQARIAAEQAGFQVVGGYMSPGHDDYIRLKTKDDWVPIHERIQLTQQIIGDRAWLSIDPWEGQFNTAAINFTDVIVRLEAYLERHIGTKIPVFYVFGGDNARFAKTFDNQGYGICVERPGYSAAQFNNPRILTASGTDNISSTQIRASQKANPVSAQDNRSDTATVLRLRIGESPGEWQVAAALRSRFEAIRIQTVEQQREIFAGLKTATPCVSLDTEISGDNPLGISRHYDLFGARRLRYGNRPGVDLIQQLHQLPFKTCCLFDDDIHSGGTMRFATSLLRKRHIAVQATIALSVSQDHEEIADARDFLFGFSDNAGLVVQLPGGLCRLPYLYPFVCPYLRASIRDPLAFSIEMWQLSADLHKSSAQTLGDLPYLAPLLATITVDPATTLRQYCLEQVETLAQLDTNPNKH